MTLENIDRKELSPEDKGDHWGIFKAYKDTRVHQAIREGIEAFISASEEQSIFSAQMNSAVLDKIGFQTIPGETDLAPNVIGSLFGMILWNQLALGDETWIMGGHAFKRNKYHIPQED